MFESRHKKNRSGVTLVEMMVAVAIMGSVFALTKFGSDLLKGMMIQRSFVDAQRQAELALYRIRIDINSANSINEIDRDHMQLKIYDFEKGYDVAISTSLFSDVNMSTVTYTYVRLDNMTALQRIVEFPDGRIHKENFLTNILVSTDTTILDGQPFDARIFDIGTTGSGVPPFDSVKVFFNLRMPYGRNMKRYEEEFTKRGFLG